MPGPLNTWPNQFAGKFDLESVFLLASLVFYFAGNTISFAEALNSDGSLHANQAQVTFGKTKNGGGEVRTLNALDHLLCPVHALALMVTVVPVKRVAPDEKGRVVQMIRKQVATALGTDASTIATQSIRRGAATLYLMSGNEW